MNSESQLFTTLDALIHRTETLVALKTDYEQRAKAAEAEVITLRETVRLQQKQIRQLEKNQVSGTAIVDKSVSFSKLVSDKLANTTDAADIKQKLDEYIDCIDRCIAQLSTLS
jgi:7-cyano-7-deazaguanine synthase in queuosine biosynthesis